MKIVALLFVGQIRSDFEVRMQLCLDAESSSGVVQAAQSDKELCIKLDSGSREKIRLPYDEVGSDVMTRTMSGDLAKASDIEVTYMERNILCLKQLFLQLHLFLSSHLLQLHLFLMVSVGNKFVNF